MTNEKPRGEPVTLEEMTRRRDGWRRRWDETDRELRAVLARERALEKRVAEAECAVHNHASIVSRLRGAVTAANAEARQFAEECGRLRDELARQCPVAERRCPHCGGPVNYFQQCLVEIWSGRLQH